MVGVEIKMFKNKKKRKKKETKKYHGIRDCRFVSILFKKKILKMIIINSSLTALTSTTRISKKSFYMLLFSIF